MSTNTLTHKWYGFQTYYFKYGDTLYMPYRIIYLVVKGDNHDCSREGRSSNR